MTPFIRCPVVITLIAVLACAASTQVGVQPFSTQETCDATRIHVNSDVLSDSDGTPLWNASYGGNASQFIWGATSLKAGGYAFVGAMTTASSDLWLGVVDSDGILMWNKTYGGDYADSGLRVFEEDSGFLIGGYAESYGAGGYDLWLLRTDGEGNVVGNITIGTVNHEVMQDMIRVSNGGYLILAVSTDLSWAKNFTLVRLDSELNQLWNASFDRSPDDTPFGVTELKDGGFAAVGWTKDAADDEDAWVIKTDSDGNHVANYTYGVADREDTFYSVVQMEDESLSLFGHTDAFGAGLYDFWLLRIDSVGAVVLNKTYGGTGSDIGDYIVRPRTGGLVAVGRTMSFGADGVDGWLARLDDDGNILWNATYGGADHDYTRFVTEVDRGGFLACGWSRSYGPGSNGGWLVLVPELLWLEQPSDLNICQEQALEHTLNATSAADMIWSLNTTSGFSVNESGVLSSVDNLAIGTYSLNVTVTDAVGNAIWADFRVTVTAATTTTQPTDYLLIDVALVGTVVVLGLIGVGCTRRKHHAALGESG